MKTKLNGFFIELLKLTIIGTLIGIIITLFKLVAHYVISLSQSIFFSEDILSKSFAIFFGICLIFISYAIIRWDGNIQGSGLPQFKLNAIKSDTKHFNWIRSLSLMFTNSCISFFLGLPVGSEAPANFIGGTIGVGLNNHFNHTNDHKDDLNVAMGTGFTIAFGTPIAGIFYTLEEVMHKFSLTRIAKTIYTIAIAFCISLLLHQEPLITLSIASDFDYSFLYVFLFVILFNVISSIVILCGVPLLKKFCNAHYNNFFIKYRFLFFAFFTFAIYLAFPLLGGTGSSLITFLGNNPGWMIVLLIVIYRLIVFVFTANSMASGGLLLPVLAIGAANGYLACCVGNAIGGLNSIYFPLFVLIGMTSLFAATNKAPITGAFLAIAISGYKMFVLVFPIAVLVCFLCFLPVQIFKLDDMIDSRFKLLRTSRKDE